MSGNAASIAARTAYLMQEGLDALAWSARASGGLVREKDMR